MSDNARPAKVVHLQRSRVGERPAGGPFCRHTGAQYEFEKAVNGEPTQQSAAVPGPSNPLQGHVLLQVRSAWACTIYHSRTLFVTCKANRAESICKRHERKGKKQQQEGLSPAVLLQVQDTGSQQRATMS